MRKFPTNIKSAKKVCTNMCKSIGLTITFDDKWLNFGSLYNQCCSAGKAIDCSFFQDWNYDLLVFAVCHEIGHFMQRNDNSLNDKIRFFLELDAWHKAIKLYVSTFGRNISIKQARYMMNCLNSYLPDYNNCERSEERMEESEHSFWCPKSKKILRK